MVFNHPELIFKISMFAMENVGKETLFSKYIDGFLDYNGSMTLHGIAFASKDLQLYGKGIRNSVWIFASDFRERFNPLFRYSIKGNDGVLLMYDITNAKSLEWLSPCCQEIKNNLDYDPPILLVGNKLDLEENREISKEIIEIFKENHDISSSMEISLKTGENVEEMFTEITRMILTKRYPDVIK
ncbi:MAG: Rab family GTPase [Candidatus Odinarchaeota archaeon]